MKKLGTKAKAEEAPAASSSRVGRDTDVRGDAPETRKVVRLTTSVKAGNAGHFMGVDSGN